MRLKVFLVLFLAGSLAACVMPANGGAASPTTSPTPARVEYTQPPQNTPTRPESTQTPSPTPPARCVVRTGYQAGTVYVRGGPGMSWPVVDVVSEGESLPLFGRPANGWQRVTTARLVDGWFYVSTWCKK